MKFHALALCVVGAAATAAPACAGDKYQSTIAADRVTVTRTTTAPGTYAYEERMYFIGNLYPDLPPIDEVAAKVSEIVTAQRTEIAHLSAMAPAARTAGYDNVVLVYDTMVPEHDRLADFGSDWLARHGYPVPAENVNVTLSDMAPPESVEHMIAMHQESFDRALARRQGERSATVRGMLLWQAATANRHLSWLRTLDRDVDLGRRVASARLRASLNGEFSERTVEEILTEERALYGTVAQEPQVIEQVVEVPVTVEKIVEVERIVEKPVERIVERVVEKPVYVERIVEKPVYITRPSSRVAGRRGTYRRPAK